MSGARSIEWVSTTLHRGLREAGFDRVEEVRFDEPEPSEHESVLRFEFSRRGGPVHALRVPATGPVSPGFVTWTSLPVDRGSKVRVERFARLADRLRTRPDTRFAPEGGLRNSDAALVERVRSLGVLRDLPEPDSRAWREDSWGPVGALLGLPRYVAEVTSDLLALREVDSPDTPAARALLTLLADGVPLAWAARRVVEAPS